MMQSPRSVLNIPSMATTNSASVSLKLLIDPKSHKVLFAEASKEVVDFLFSFLNRIPESYGIPCPQCRSCNISTPVSYVSPSAPTGATSSNIKAGYVKGIDALQVKEGLKLVKASSESNTALTNVFLGKKQHKLFNFGPLAILSFWGFILKTHPPSQQSFNFIVDPEHIRRPILY
ncbi:unnamed protein product [Prunus armeniaca]